MPPFSSLQLNLILLDAALTDRPWNEVVHNAGQKLWTVEKWLDDVYYLSDGGYSRIALNKENLQIFPTSNSRPRIFEMWPMVPRLIRTVEELIHQEILDLGWDLA